MSRPAPVHVCVGLLVAAAVPLLAVVLHGTPWEAVGADPVVFAVLAGMVVIGEMRPIMISHGDDSVDIVTISCCFTLALVTGQSVIDLTMNAVANLGWDEVRLPHPLFEGDTVYAKSEVLETRASKSRPNMVTMSGPRVSVVDAAGKMRVNL